MRILDGADTVAKSQFELLDHVRSQDHDSQTQVVKGPRGRGLWGVIKSTLAISVALPYS